MSGQPEPRPTRPRPIEVKKTLLLVALLAVTACTDSGDVRITPGGAPPSDRAAESATTGLRVELQAKASGADREVLVRLIAKDDDGGGPGYRIQYGDGTYEEVVLADTACAGPLPVTPPPYTPEPFDKIIGKRHKYAKAGMYAVQVRVVSQRPCAGPEEANAQASVKIE